MSDASFYDYIDYLKDSADAAADRQEWLESGQCCEATEQSLRAQLAERIDALLDYQRFQHGPTYDVRADGYNAGWEKAHDTLRPLLRQLVTGESK